MHPRPPRRHASLTLGKNQPLNVRRRQQPPKPLDARALLGKSSPVKLPSPRPGDVPRSSIEAPKSSNIVRLPHLPSRPPEKPPLYEPTKRLAITSGEVGVSDTKAIAIVESSRDMPAVNRWLEECEEKGPMSMSLLDASFPPFSPIIQVTGPPAASREDELPAFLKTAPGSFQSYTSLEAAKVRRQLFMLCQQLFRGSKTEMEITVKENGNVVWQSSNYEDDVPIVDVGVLDEDITAVQQRSHNAFGKTVRMFHKKIGALLKQIDELKEELRSREVGGTKYNALQSELEGAKHITRKQDAKIKALAKMLDHAGQQLKTREYLGEGSVRRGDQEPLNWQPLQAVFSDLILEDRTDAAILRDVAQSVERQAERVQELDSSNEMFAEKCAEKEVFAENCRRERDRSEAECMAIMTELERTTAKLDRLQDDYNNLQIIYENHRADANDEISKIRDRLSQAEEALRRTTEAKKFFVGHGRASSIPPYLRFDGRIQNLDLPKKDVEGMINLLWATYDAPSRMSSSVAVRKGSLGMSAQMERRIERLVINELNSEFMQLMDSPLFNISSGPPKSPRPGASVSLSLSDSSNPGNVSVLMLDLVDYDNLSVRPHAASHRPYDFDGHIARFVLEKYAADKFAALLTPEGSLKPGASMPQSCAELTYSLIEACEKYKFDADVELFRRVIRKELPEEAYYDQMIMIQKLRVALIFRFHAVKTASTESSATRPAMGPGAIVSTFGAEAALSVRDIMSVLHSFFPAKPADSFEVLRTALIEDAASTICTPKQEAKRPEAPDDHVLSIPKLFASNEMGNQGKFAEAVRDQHLEESLTYASEVAFAISSAGMRTNIELDNSAGGSQAANTATIAQVRQKLLELDPKKPIDDINGYLMHLLRFALPPELSSSFGADTIHFTMVVDCDLLAEKAKNVWSKRYGSRPECSSPRRRRSTRAPSSRGSSSGT